LTLFKEVDAKIYTPEKELFRLIQQAEDMPTLSKQGPWKSTRALPPADVVTDPFDASNLARRQLYSQIILKLQSMIGSLEEKNHVVTMANVTLDKQLARIEDVFPHVQDEFSDEAKYGNPNHWAYPENRVGNNHTNGSGNAIGSNSRAAQAERSRREGAATISAAAQALADEAAARSDARKQAVQAKKNFKAQQQQQQQQQQYQGADAKGEGHKKASGNSKARKPLPDSIPASSEAAASGNPSKRRKIEKPTTKPAIVAPASVLSVESSQATAVSLPVDPRATGDDSDSGKLGGQAQGATYSVLHSLQPSAILAEADQALNSGKEASKKRKTTAASCRSKSKYVSLNIVWSILHESFVV